MVFSTGQLLELALFCIKIYNQHDQCCKIYYIVPADDNAANIFSPFSAVPFVHFAEIKNKVSTQFCN